jgi:molybdenum cofactor synthesis domain-containing protein
VKIGILTISDRSSQGLRPDTGGPGLSHWLQQQGVNAGYSAIVADEIDLIAAQLCAWADEDALDLILTTGGTGVSPRDVTPEATAMVLERIIPGLSELMRSESLKKTPMAILSRAMAGIRKRTLIINLPGSPKGAVENLAAVWAAVPHAVAKIQGSPEECANLFPQKQE